MIKTCTLETARLLKEAAFKQETHYQWADVHNVYRIWQNEDVVSWPHQESFIGWKQENRERCISSPTTDELLEELKKIEYESNGFPSLMIFYVFGKWSVCFRNPPISWIEKGSQSAGENIELVEACAGLWLWLKKEGLIEVRK